jgi:hypothetical protein
MKTTSVSTLAVTVGLVFSAAPMLAHQPVDLVGTVTKVDWVNPHSWISIDVKSGDGTVVNWGRETGAPNVLLFAGSPDSGPKQ